MYSSHISRTRREFLRDIAGVCTMASLFPVAQMHSQAMMKRSDRKVVIATFGGGARDEETFSIRGHRNIPSLLNDLAPRACFFSQVVNKGILGHYVATASIATGTYENFDNFIAQPPPNPTLFEYFRSAFPKNPNDAWVIAPNDNFAQIAASSHRSCGPSLSARIVLPRQLLLSSLPQHDDSLYSYLDLMHDSYEAVPDTASRERAHRLIEELHIAPNVLSQSAAGTLSPDTLSLYVAKQVMAQHSPSLLFLTFHDIDIAHLGAFSLYLNAVQQTDVLCGELWRFIQNQPEYRDKTTLIILPDFGRDGDGEPGGNGFQHHRTGGALARTTWMMALGPNVHEHSVVGRPVESIDLVPTIGRMLGFDTPHSHGRVIKELL